MLSLRALGMSPLFYSFAVCQGEPRSIFVKIPVVLPLGCAAVEQATTVSAASYPS